MSHSEHHARSFKPGKTFTMIWGQPITHNSLLQAKEMVEKATGLKATVRQLLTAPESMEITLWSWQPSEPEILIQKALRGH